MAGMKKISDEDVTRYYLEGKKNGDSLRKIAKRCGYSSHPSLTKRLKSLGLQEYDVIHPVSPEIPIDELIEQRKKKFARKTQYEDDRKLIPVNVKISGPIGILHFGDPHVDDDGTDIGLLEYHTDLVRETEGLFAGNIGDTTNNWIGRLARLYGEQSTSAQEAWKLCEWFINRCDWLYIIGGNHDAWSGAGDPLKWIAARQNALYESSEVRLKINFPGKVKNKSIVINARHDFAGTSQWNPAHAVGKAAQLGCRDNILICGHKHKSGYMILKDEHEGTIQHALQIASYKIYDRFAREKGFRDQHISPSVLTVIDPNSDSQVGLITVFHDINKGVDFLNYIRKYYK